MRHWELGAICGGSGKKGIDNEFIFAHRANTGNCVGHVRVQFSLPCGAVGLQVSSYGPQVCQIKAEHQTQSQAQGPRDGLLETSTSVCLDCSPLMGAVEELGIEKREGALDI